MRTLTTARPFNKAIPWHLMAAAAMLILVAQPSGATTGEDQKLFFGTVRCDDGQSISRALHVRRFFRQITVKFTGACDEDVVIARDHVTLVGVSEDATILGLIDVFGGSNVTFQDFTILGDIFDPVDTGRGAINAENGGAITVDNVHIQTQNVRGLRVINSTAALNNVSMDDILVGAFVFRASNVTFSGDIVATRSVFGMTFVDSNGNARNANLTFDDNFFAGLIVQINSGFEHVEGTLSANNNPIGLLVASNAVYAHGSFVDVSGSATAGILVDEFSSVTPLVGAPGGGPDVTVTDNPGDGLVVSRYSTLETQVGTVTGNATGLSVDNGEVRLATTTIQDNATDVSLVFDAKLTANGEDNVVGSPIECDGSVLTRGALSCGAAASSVVAAALELAGGGRSGDVPAAALLGVMGRVLRQHR